MKVKLKKHKKSPAPCATEQVKVKSTIETLRNARAYGVPIYVVYDRGYQQFIDLADRIQKNKEKTTALCATEQMKKHFTTLNWIYSRIKEIREVSEISEACELLKTEEWICLKIFEKKRHYHFRIV